MPCVCDENYERDMFASRDYRPRVAGDHVRKKWKPEKLPLPAQYIECTGRYERNGTYHLIPVGATGTLCGGDQHQHRLWDDPAPDAPLCEVCAERAGWIAKHGWPD